MKTSKIIVGSVSLILINLAALSYVYASNRIPEKNNTKLFTNILLKKIHVLTNNNKASATPFAGKLVFLSKDYNTLIYSGTEIMRGDKALDKFSVLYQSSFDKMKSQWNEPELLEFDKNIEKSQFGKRYLFITDKGQKDIYIIRQLVSGKWTYPEKLNKNINSKYMETSAFLSPDGNTLYFTSNRPGGYGGMDIYKSEKMETGDWGEAQNLGPKINTDMDEESPFILSDGVTMYFSSEGHEGMGGFDVFITTLSNEGIWSKPENAGKEINTKEDDLFFYMSDDGKCAFFSTISTNFNEDMTIHRICF